MTKSKFKKAIPIDGDPEGRAITVWIDTGNSHWIEIEIAGEHNSETLSTWEARAIAAALNKAADRIDAVAARAA